MSKFKTPNGKAEVSVPNDRDAEMISRGMVLAGNTRKREDAKKKTESKDREALKPLDSEVKTA